MHRMTVAKQGMLQRMRNFHHDDVYPAISEALGVIAALGEFYGGPAPDQRSRIAIIAGDPAPGRFRLNPEEERAELPNGRTLQPQQARMIRILSDGEPLDPEELLKKAGSRARGKAVVGAAIRNLRAAIKDSGVTIEEDALGRLVMPEASCATVAAIMGDA